MCWSKRSQEDEDSRPNTTPKPMGETRCKGIFKPCVLPNSETYCSGHGQCCFNGDEQNSLDKSCVCDLGRTGRYCQNIMFEESRKDFQRTQAIAAFSAVLGVIVITLFVALIVLQIKYYRRRKKRRRMLTDVDHELMGISRPDAGDIGSKKILITQPGYSWRESVRRTRSKASHKLRSALSRSVPDDLFQVGLKLAIFGGCHPNLSPSDHQPTVGKKAEVKAVATQRCFSADPDPGDRQTICDQKDNANASNRPITVQMPTTAAAAAAAAATTTTTRTEDTVK